MGLVLDRVTLRIGRMGLRGRIGLMFMGLGA